MKLLDSSTQKLDALSDAAEFPDPKKSDSKFIYMSRSCAIKKPRTIPGKILWLIASLINAMRLSTRNVPGMAQAAATNAAVI